MGSNKPHTVELGGSILADKHMETLEGLMKAYEARLKANETIEQRWRRYPDPVNEERQLEMYKRLMEATQALLDQVSHPHLGENKNTSQKSNKTEPEKEEKQEEQSTREGKSSQKSFQIPRRYPTSHVPEVEDALVDGLWEELKQRKLETHENKPPPLKEIDFDQKTLVLELKSKLADAASEKTVERDKGTLKTLPSF